ncbi:hypothetical protein [Niabella sp.]|uniref:hypothetical protein n=1 Tax=Niabella sp. TaxID=1962976 RepID=UPI00261BEA0B|nr:hypothetical protein [Niabella sp.]
MSTTLSLFSRLTSIPLCDDALKQAYRDQKTLLWKKLGLELQIERRLDRLAATEAQLRSKELALEHASNVAAQLEETHPEREEYLDAATGFRHQVALLEIRIQKLPPQWLTQKELQLQYINAALEKLSLLILELETHKAGILKQEAAEPQPTTPTVSPEGPPVPVPVMKTVPVQKDINPRIGKRKPKNDAPLKRYGSG